MSELSLPAITADEMRLVDDLMVEKYGIALPQMMEMAGRHLADLAWERFLAKSKTTLPQVVVVCGVGNNGGGGMVAARYLANRGLPVTVVLAGTEAKLKPISRQQWETLKQLPVKLLRNDENKTAPVFQSADLIVDALIGYGLKGPLRGRPGEIANKIMQLKQCPILSLDIPSGLNATDGTTAGTTIKADATMTLALPKTGLLKTGVDQFVGDLYLADIGVPPELYRQIGLAPQYLFIDAPIIPVTIQK